MYVLGHLAYQTDQNGTVLATFTYDSRGVPASVQVGSDPATAPRYYYVYNGHGDVVALVDAQGNVAASYAYDAFGQLTSFSENFGGTTTWTNPYLYDGRDGVRYDGETGLSWMSVRAYDPELGRFLSRDPLNRVPLFFSEQPYAYAGNNPLIHVDPSGQRFYIQGMSGAEQAQVNKMAIKAARIYTRQHPRKDPGVKPLSGLVTPQNPLGQFTASCGEEFCSVGHHQTGGLFSLLGYNTSKIELVGLHAIQDFVAKLQGAASIMSGMIFQAGAITTGAIVTVMGALGAIMGAPFGPGGAATGAGLGGLAGGIESIPIDVTLYYYYKVMIDIVAKAVRRLDKLAYSLRNIPDTPLVVDVEERQWQIPWWSFTMRAEAEVLRAAGIFYGAILVTQPCPNGVNCIAPGAPQD